MAEQKAFQLSIDMLPEIDLRTFRPKGNRLLIKPIPIAETKVGSIHIGDGQVDQIRRTCYNRGTVVLTGTGIEDKEIVPGSTVFFYRHASEGAFRVGQEEHLLYCEYNIVADINPDPLLSITPIAIA